MKLALAYPVITQPDRQRCSIWQLSVRQVALRVEEAPPLQQARLECLTPLLERWQPGSQVQWGQRYGRAGSYS
eukprot:scaffold98373_cov26-Tisochrysis_lutea.AAC.1